MHRLTQEELAKRLGITQPAVAAYERGRIIPTLETLDKIAKVFGVAIDDITGTKRKGVKIPVLGSVVAGVPIEAITDIEDYEELSQDLANTGEFYALRVKGRSMEPEIKPNDRLIIKMQNTCDTGDIAVVLVNGNEATVKKVKKLPDGIMLIGFNNEVYEPHSYTAKEVQELPILIIGVVVEIRRRLK